MNRRLVIDFAYLVTLTTGPKGEAASLFVKFTTDIPLVTASHYF